MAKYRITSPDGGTYEINAPDDATQAQVMQYAQSQFSQQRPQVIDPTANLDPTEGMSGLQRFSAGAGKAVYDLARGAGQMLGVTDQASIDEARRLDAPLVGTGAGMAGNIAGNVAAALPSMFIPGVNTVAGAGLVGAGLGALQPTAEGESRLMNAGVSAIGGAGGQMAGRLLGRMATSNLANRTAAGTAAQSENAVRDAAALAARQQGYVIPPTQVNPSAANRVLEGFAGKITTGQQASSKNQAVTNRMVRNALGLAEDAPLTDDTLKAIRDTAGRAYEGIKAAGPVTADDAFFSRLDSLKSTFEGAAKDFPELARSDIGGIVESLKKETFDSGSAIDAIRILRGDADKAFAAGDKALGKVYRGASDAMEDLLQRNLERAGNTELLDQFKNARQLIAKTYTVEKALNPATGNVNAQKLGKMLERGKPLAGDLKKAARFAQAFPKAAQEINSSIPGVSPLDFAVGGLSSAAMQNPLALASVAARPAVRSAILSQPFQGLLKPPSYGPGLLSQMAPQALGNEMTPALSGLLGSGMSINAIQQ